MTKATAIGPDDATPLTNRITAFYIKLERDIRRRSPASEAFSNVTSEPVLRQLEELLRGKVGKAQSQEEWEATVKKGIERIKRKKPPGYLDANKAESDLPEGPAGDYLVWHQTISEAARRNLDVVLITADEKEDWWRRYRSELLGPRPELVDELKALCGRQLYMMRPIDLLMHSSALDVSVRSESVDDVERVTRESEYETTSSRNEDTSNELVEVGLHHLIDLARNGKTTSHAAFREVLRSRIGSGFDPRIPSQRVALGRLLDLIVQRNYPETNLMISALVINMDSNGPGQGFYRMAQSLGLLQRGANGAMKFEFWLKQVQSLYAYYSSSS